MRLTRTRKAALAALALTTAAGLAGCGGGAEPGGGSGGDGGGGQASAWVITGGTNEMVAENISSFDDGAISVEQFANDAFKEKIRTAVGSGEAPTLIHNWTGGTLVDYVENDSVIDLGDSTPDLIDRVLPSVAQNGEVDGGQYAVPYSEVQPVVLYYNTDLFEQAGVEVPQTWDDLLAAVETFKDEGVIPFALAGQSVWPELMWIQYLTDRIGGPEVFQAVLDGKPDAWSDPAVLEALERIQQLEEAGAFGDNFASVTADANADVALVHTGKAAMLLQGGWVYGAFKTDAPDFVSDGTLGFSTFPAIDGGKGDPANIAGNPANFWSVSSADGEEAQETATTYLNEELYSDAYVDDLLAAGGVPPVVGIEDKLAETDDAEFFEFVYGMVEDAPHFQLSWDQALSSGQAQELLTNLSRIFLGEITPQQFVDNMNATL
jgi:raffinose/stachyose/melibiose transport system substrate-binding protein